MPSLESLAEGVQTFVLYNAIGVGVLLAANQFVGPLLVPLWRIKSKDRGFDGQQGLTIDDDAFEGFNTLPTHYGTLEYLVTASAIVHNRAEGIGVCRHYAAATFDTYTQLLGMNDRQDIRKNIRLATGRSPEGYGHAVIEYKSTEGVRHYETTAYAPSDSIEEEATFREQHLIHRLSKTWTRTFWGSKVFYPTKQLFFQKGGTFGVILDSLGPYEKERSQEDRIGAEDERDTIR